MEPESFDEIYQSHFDPVYRYVLSLSRDPHVAEEITQETFFKALRSLDHLDFRTEEKEGATHRRSIGASRSWRKS